MKGVFPIQQAKLDNYRFSGYHKSHVGALKSCLDYYKLPCSAPWLFGMTGSAFLSIVDEGLSAPNVGEPEEEIFRLARHLGLDIHGTHTFAGKTEIVRLQREAWDLARSAINRGLPVFAKELDLGNETSLIYAYDESGYYTHSWHGGNGHDGSDEVIPWNMLGRAYCPCAECKAKRNAGEIPYDTVYCGDPQEGGFVSLHWASPRAPSDERTSLREALRFVLECTRRGRFEWGGRAFYSGPAAYDPWIAALRNRTILAFYMGYYTDIFHESRRYAHLFLQEAAERFEDALAQQLERAAEHYKLIRAEFQALNECFPWMQPREPIEDPDRRSEAVERLTRIKELEREGEPMLIKLLES